MLEPCGLFCPVDIDSPADALAHFDTIAAGSGVRCGLEGLGSGHLGEDISCVQLARGVGCACCRRTGRFSCRCTQSPRCVLRNPAQQTTTQVTDFAKTAPARFTGPVMANLLAVSVLVLCFPKFIPFPFCVPFYLLGLLYLIYAAERGTARTVVALLVAFQFAPLALVTERRLSEVASWGMQGPNAGRSPLQGVYLFEGLSAATVDFSHCLWSASSRTAYCHLPMFHSASAEAGFVDNTADAGVDAHRHAQLGRAPAFAHRHAQLLHACRAFLLSPLLSPIGAAALLLSHTRPSMPVVDVAEAGFSREELRAAMPRPLFYMFHHVIMHSRIDFVFNEVCMHTACTPQCTRMCMCSAHCMCTASSCALHVRIPGGHRGAGLRERLPRRHRLALAALLPVPIRSLHEGYRQPLLPPVHDGQGSQQSPTHLVPSYPPNEADAQPEPEPSPSPSPSP